ncbi:MAG: type II toxin-antitoxin system RelE/ParE family toxin [Coriobacteriia bacterium]|nr:type II toxin-antitoxin system RelE/ParE family toxin [Coriobacteriia bacterium]
MAHQIRFDAVAKKQLKKFDPSVAHKILDYLEEVAQLEDARSRGHALKGNLRGFWCYRWTNIRIICDIQDRDLIIYVLDVDNRDKVYD